MPLINAEKQKQYQERLKERFSAAELREKESKRHKLKKVQNIDKGEKIKKGNMIINLTKKLAKYLQPHTHHINVK